MLRRYREDTKYLKKILFEIKYAGRGRWDSNPRKMPTHLLLVLNQLPSAKLGHDPSAFVKEGGSIDLPPSRILAQ